MAWTIHRLSIDYRDSSSRLRRSAPPAIRSASRRDGRGFERQTVPVAPPRATPAPVASNTARLTRLARVEFTRAPRGGSDVVLVVLVVALSSSVDANSSNRGETSASPHRVPLSPAASMSAPRIELPAPGCGRRTATDRSARRRSRRRRRNSRARSAAAASARTRGTAATTIHPRTVRDEAPIPREFESDPRGIVLLVLARPIPSSNPAPRRRPNPIPRNSSSRRRRRRRRRA